MRRKPIALMGASPGNFGTVRAQLALRQTFLFTESYVALKPEVHVFHAAERFDAQGTLRDATTQELVRGLLDALMRSPAVSTGPLTTHHRPTAE